MYELVFVGDICPGGRNVDLFAEGCAFRIYGDLTKRLNSADLTIGNLECPIIEKKAPIEKSGPVFGAPNRVLNGILAGGFNALGLANNHIFDHGENGLENTINLCRGAGIRVVGAGRNLDAASKALCLSVGGELNVGIIAVTEHEFSVATSTCAGANPMDVFNISEQVASLREKEKCDCIILLVHGGKEYYPYPTPNLQKFCRFVVDQGVDIVLCQHSHCIGSYEKYKNAFILYGQGDFISERLSTANTARQVGILVSVEIDRKEISDVQLIPTVQSWEVGGVDLLKGCQMEEVLKELEQRSLDIRSANYVEERWREHCVENRYRYFSILRGHNRISRYINKRLHYSDMFYNAKDVRALWNVVRCETHREVIETMLREEIFKE